MKLFFWILFLCCFLQAKTQPAGKMLPEEKEKYIQQAIALRKTDQFMMAIVQLDSILLRMPNDPSTLLFKGDLQLQSKIYKKAVATYSTLLPLQYEPTIVKINLSYALFMNHQPAKALHFAKAAWVNAPKNTAATVNYFNAMLWNSKTGAARKFLYEKIQNLSPELQIVLQARLFTTSGDYKTGLHFYDSLVKTYPDKYFVQEVTEVLVGKKELRTATGVYESHKSLFSTAEQQALAEKIKNAKMQNAGTEFVYFKDIAKNIRVENSVWWQDRENKKYRLRVSAGTGVITANHLNKTNASFLHLTVNERWNMAWSGQTDLHLQSIVPENTKGFKGLTGKQSIQYQPNDRRMVGLYYSTDILNFTASLLQKNIRSNNIGYTTHLMPNGKTGFYSQGSIGALSDQNSRYQFFGSIYRLFRTEPTLKTGINFSALHFKDSSIKNYFSPHQYLNTEIFTDFSTPLPNLSKFYLQVQAAAGVQKIEQQNWEAAFRFQSELGFRLKHFETAIKYQWSDVASISGAGYQFDWFTFRFLWKW